MAKSAKSSKPSKSSRSARVTARSGPRHFCSVPVLPEREFAPGVTPFRARLIRENQKKWVNGTVLHYYFFDQPGDGEHVTLSNGTQRWIPWTTSKAEKDIVRAAFKAWKDLGVGLKFEEVGAREDAELRIGFMRGDGAWSYIGRDVLHEGANGRTMNFGWNLTAHASEIDTAIHEIGHSLGFPHEHQNPNAGIEWDEEAVYAALAAPPNNWPRETTHWNIIRKLPADTVQGSSWDPDSVMHYPFGPGLIKAPPQFINGLNPAGGLSARDATWVKTFYPPLAASDHLVLEPLKSQPLSLQPAQQANYIIDPPATRMYEIRTFGQSDTVIVLFENQNGNLRYVRGDDDSGEDRNAYLKLKLFKGRKYVLRVRLYYADRAGDTAVMLW